LHDQKAAQANVMNVLDPSVFIADLPVFAEFEDVADLSRYRPLPDGWALALADVVSSGAAIAAGKYKMVNMAGASVITALLNALGRNDFPFVFGGDGAAVAVPPEGIEAARTALAAVARWISEDLGLQMRVALVPVSAIRAAGHDIRVARHQASPDLSFSMFAGGGSSWAEAQMKQGAFAIEPAPPGTRPDLTGLSCRWNPIESRNGQIVSIIAVARSPAVQEAFRDLVAKVLTIAGEGDAAGSPLPPEGPKPIVHLGGVEAEVNATAPPGKRLSTRLKIIFAIVVTLILYRTNLTLGGFNARNYGRELARNSDFRKFDDGLKMTIDIDAGRMARIEAVLQAASDQGVCQFGMHSQTSALITCIIPSVTQSDHIHFIDGAAGGYAQAATQMKAKAAR
jgi:hypothetical protein